MPAIRLPSPARTKARTATGRLRSRCRRLPRPLLCARGCAGTFRSGDLSDRHESLPNTPANTGPTQDSGFSIKVTSRLVDVGVVAFDKKGHPVTDLKAEDFEIYDNGRKQEIRFFTPAPAQCRGGGPGTVLAC